MNTKVLQKIHKYQLKLKHNNDSNKTHIYQKKLRHYERIIQCGGNGPEMELVSITDLKSKIKKLESENEGYKKTSRSTIVMVEKCRSHKQELESKIKQFESSIEECKVYVKSCEKYGVDIKKQTKQYEELVNKLKNEIKEHEKIAADSQKLIASFRKSGKDCAKNLALCTQLSQAKVGTGF